MAKANVKRDTILLSTKSVSKILNLSPRTVHRLNSSGLIIKPLKVSGSIRYVKSELMAWIDAGMPRRSEWQAIKQETKTRYEKEENDD